MRTTGLAPKSGLATAGDGGSKFLVQTRLVLRIGEDLSSLLHPDGRLPPCLRIGLSFYLLQPVDGSLSRRGNHGLVTFAVAQPEHLVGVRLVKISR